MQPTPYPAEPAPEPLLGPGGVQLDPQRSFTKEQKDIARRRQKNRCAWCGVKLRRSDHGDHIFPWSLGGRTTLDNLQMLCSDCNLEKSAGTNDSEYDHRRQLGRVAPWPAELAPRPWAAEFHQAVRHHQRRDFLLFATPAAGKTLAALAVAHERFTRGEIDRLVIVAPTRAVREQWRAAAFQVGIQLQSRFVGLPLPHWCNGVVITYSAVLYGQVRLAELCRQERVMLILDEVHHAADKKEWGTSLADALNDLEGARFRLSLSGTPFRTDGLPIVGLRLTPRPDDPRWLDVQADYEFGYRAALEAERVVRPVVFAGFDGEVRWIEPAAPDDIQAQTFATPLGPRRARWRLETFLKSESAMKPILREAHRHLLAMRRGGDSRAQGLLIAMQRSHAVMLAGWLEEVTGERPAFVVCDEPGAADTLRTFEESGKRWLVAVRMASEGYDNKHLRVGVYAAAYTTEMFFRQFVGRFVRYNAELGERQVAAVFMPNEERLVKLARVICAEVEDYARIRTSRTRLTWLPDDRVVYLRPEPLPRDPDREFVPVDATSDLAAVYRTEGVDWLDVDAARAQAYLQRHADDVAKADRLRRELNRLIRRTGRTPAQLRRRGARAA